MTATAIQRRTGTLADMAKRDDLEFRVSALETEVGDLSQRVRRTAQDAAAARVLAGGADRDVNEIRDELRDFRQATTSSFNAMREDLTDLRQEMNDRFNQVDNRFIAVDGKLDFTAAGIQHITDLLNTVIDQRGAPGDRER